MSLATIVTSIVTAGTNSHPTTSAEANSVATDFVTQGVNGTIANTSGTAPSTGAFAVNAQGTPAMFVDVTLGTAYISATPSGQTAQVLRAYMSANTTSYTINANASGSTKYDWIYLKISPTAANNPDTAGDDVTSIFTSRSSSNASDNGSPPTYGIPLVVVTVANGASSITAGNIQDKRTNAYILATSPTTLTSTYDYVDTGCVWSADSAGATLNGSMTSGVVRINGKVLTVNLITAHAFTASKDTYIDLSDNGDGTATIYYTETTNNATSPALSTNYLRIAIVVTGAGSIAAASSINQGQEDRILPIASSIPYCVTDSLGNLICPRDPRRRLLGYRQITGSLSGLSATSATAVTGLSVTFLPILNRKYVISTGGTDWQSAGAQFLDQYIYDTNTSGSVLGHNAYTAAGANGFQTNAVETKAVTASASSAKTVIAAYNVSTSSTTLRAGTSVAWIKVESI